MQEKVKGLCEFKAIQLSLHSKFKASQGSILRLCLNMKEEKKIFDSLSLTFSV